MSRFCPKCRGELIPDGAGMMTCSGCGITVLGPMPLDRPVSPPATPTVSRPEPARAAYREPHRGRDDDDDLDLEIDVESTERRGWSAVSAGFKMLLGASLLLAIPCVGVSTRLKIEGPEVVLFMVCVPIAAILSFVAAFFCCRVPDPKARNAAVHAILAVTISAGLWFLAFLCVVAQQGRHPAPGFRARDLKMIDPSDYALPVFLGGLAVVILAIAVLRWLGFYAATARALENRLFRANVRCFLWALLAGGTLSGILSSIPGVGYVGVVFLAIAGVVLFLWHCVLLYHGIRVIDVGLSTDQLPDRSR